MHLFINSQTLYNHMTINAIATVQIQCACAVTAVGRSCIYLLSSHVCVCVSVCRANAFITTVGIQNNIKLNKDASAASRLLTSGRYCHGCCCRCCCCHCVSFGAAASWVKVSIWELVIFSTWCDGGRAYVHYSENCWKFGFLEACHQLITNNTQTICNHTISSQMKPCESHHTDKSFHRSPLFFRLSLTPFSHSVFSLFEFHFHIVSHL